jgi:carbon-monoxide dehydrogenase medium subunit
MTGLPTLQLHRPHELAEAVGLLAELGDEARVHAGGTELVLMLREGFVSAAHLVDIKGVAELGGVSLDERQGLVRLGATARHDEISASRLVRRHFPVLADLETHLANQRVRNAGTIGGNLAFAEPHADPPAFLVAAEAGVQLEGPDGTRHTPVEGWLAGAFDTDIREGEILHSVWLELPGPRTAFGYRRFKALERPSVSAAVRLVAGEDGRLESARIVLGCLGGAPIVVRGTDGILAGLGLDALDGAAADVAAAVAKEAETVTDPHGPEDYKQHLAGVLTVRAMRDAAAALRAGGVVS